MDTLVGAPHTLDTVDTVDTADTADTADPLFRASSAPLSTRLRQRLLRQESGGTPGSADRPRQVNGGGNGDKICWGGTEYGKRSTLSAESKDMHCIRTFFTYFEKYWSC